MLRSLGACALAILASASPLRGAGPAAAAVTADEALAALMEGNKRFVRGELRHPHESAARRREVAKEQHPFAAVLTCSDSRVKPSLVFDQGIGDLFEVLVAGGVVGEDVAGSVEYAVAHLGTPLVLTMGHRRCGAVTAAYHSFVARDLAEREPHEVETLLMRIEPALRELNRGRSEAQQLDEAVRLNASHSAESLRSFPALREAIESGRVVVRSAYYDIESGVVTLLEE